SRRPQAWLCSLWQSIVANRRFVPAAEAAASFDALYDAALPNDLPSRIRRSEFFSPARARRRPRDRAVAPRRDVLTQVQGMVSVQAFPETGACVQRCRASVQNPV